MRCVIVESPYAGRVEKNEVYARLALRDCLRRGEAPFASHLMYTLPSVLDDADVSERALGIAAGLAIGERMDATIVYTDYGVTPGMKQGIDAAERAGRPIEYRSLLMEKDN